MHTIRHYILWILKMRDCQSTTYKSTMGILYFWNSVDKKEFTFQTYKFPVSEFKQRGGGSTYQILSSILVCTPGAYCWLPNSQGHWLMGIQSPLSFRAWPWGQEQPSAQRVRSWVQTGLLEMMWQVRTHSLGQFWYTCPPLHGNSRGEMLKFIQTILGRWKVKVYSNYVLGIKGLSQFNVYNHE